MIPSPKIKHPRNDGLVGDLHICGTVWELFNIRFFPSLFNHANVWWGPEDS